MENLRRSVSEINKDLHLLEAATAGLNVEVRNLHEDLIDIRVTNKTLLEFMYKIQGGKAQMVGLLSLLVGLGTIVNIFVSFYFRH